MSYLRSFKVQCGRYVKKPIADEDEYDYENDELPLQAQIDNLKLKISLKERYNKALQSELRESNAGAKQMIKDLRDGNDYLRFKQGEAIKSGQFAASKALRSNRAIQLTLVGKEPVEVLDWMDDKLFDLTKKIDDKTHQFGLIKKKLFDCEQMIEELEKYPFPGSTPMEQKSINERIKIGVALTNMESLREIGKILNMKYREICQELKDERDSWPHVVMALETAYDGYKKELVDLENMLEDAIRFRDNAYYRLVMTEKEFAENKRDRKRQMARMKRSVDQGLQINARRWKKATAEISKATRSISKAAWIVDINASTIRDLKFKQTKVLEFEDRAKLLVDAMRVPNLTYCPRRLLTVRMIHERLLKEAIHKVTLKDTLLKQKTNLLLIYNHLKYTGDAKQEEYETSLMAHAAAREEFEARKKKDYQQMNDMGQQILESYRFCIVLDDQLNLGKKKTHHPSKKHEEIHNYIKVITGKIKSLMTQIDDLRGLFDPEKEPERFYGIYVQFPKTKNSCRLSEIFHDISDNDLVEDDEDENTTSSEFAERVPDREFIKAKSSRIHAQALIRKTYK